MIDAGDIFLDDDVRADGPRRFVARADLVARHQVRRHAAPLVAVLRLHDHGWADLLGGGPGVVGVADGTAVGNRHADRLEQAARELLVLGDDLGDRRRVVGLGGPDAFLPAPPAELYQAPLVQAP